MGSFDWIILAFLLVCVIYGYRKGFVGALIQLGGLALTFVLIGQYYPAVRLGLMSKYALNPILANIISFILVIVMILVIVRLVIFLLEKILRMMSLSFINHALGAVFGFVNGLLILIIIAVMIDYFPILSNKLQDPVKHRVYNGISVIKDDAMQKLKLNGKDKLMRLIEKQSSKALEKATDTKK